jgi:hypothetical protein
MRKQGKLSITPIITASLSQEDRVCIDHILCLYADAIRQMLPPSVQRGEMLTKLTRACENLALLERMPEGGSLAIDDGSVAIVQDAFTFFLTSVVPLLSLDEQEKQVIVQEAETLQRSLRGQGN